MKTTKRKVISFFVLLMLSMTIIGPVHADGENDNSHLNDWLEGIRPVDTGEVTIKVNTPKVQESENYNLSSNNKQNNKLPIDLLPSWMSQGDCINGKAGFIFFQSEIVNCETFTVKGSGMNKFSKQFFEEIIETRKEELLEKEKNDEINDISLSMDSILHTSEQTEGELSISSSGDNLDMENLVDDLAGSADESEDDILNLLGSFDLSTGENQEEVDVIETQEIISEIDSSTVVLNDGVDNEDNTGITNSGIVIGDVTSGEELKNQVDTVLQKFLNPDEYIAPVKKLEEVIEEDVIIKVEDKKGEIERDVSIDELFPNVYINSDINTFTESLFGPEVKNIMYGVEINNDLLSGISANYLAITLEKFREQKEIIEISDHELGDYQIFGLQGYHHYNSELKDLFEKFLAKKPSTDEINKVAQDLSAISFSFSTYTNRTVNLKTKNIFKNKLILDFQKLEKDYKNISKEATIRNYFIKKAEIKFYNQFKKNNSTKHISKSQINNEKLIRTDNLKVNIIQTKGLDLNDHEQEYILVTDSHEIGIKNDQTILIDIEPKELEVISVVTPSGLPILAVYADTRNESIEISAETTADIFVLRSPRFYGVKLIDVGKMSDRIRQHPDYSDVVEVIQEEISYNSPCPMDPSCNATAARIGERIAQEIEISDLVTAE